MTNEKPGAGQPGEAMLSQAGEAVSRAMALAGLYESRANSEIKSPAELEQVKHEMKAIKAEILSALSGARSALQKLQRQAMAGQRHKMLEA